jgi:hypothetical protein
MCKLLVQLPTKLIFLEVGVITFNLQFLWDNSFHQKPYDFCSSHMIYRCHKATVFVSWLSDCQVCRHIHVKILRKRLYVFREMFCKTSPLTLLHLDKAATRMRFLKCCKVRQKLCGCEMKIRRQSQKLKY